MNNPAHVGFVDSHPEGNRGTNHLAFVVDEFVLCFRAKFTVQTGVIGFGLDANFLQFLGQFFRGFSAQTIDNAALVGFVLDEIDDLFHAV